MLKNWYVQLHSGSGPSALSGKLNYDIMGVSYRSDPTKACRMYLYYSNPKCDKTLVDTDFEYPMCVDYEIEFNPAGLEFYDGSSFVDQVKDIINKAESIIHNPKNVKEYHGYGGKIEYYISPREFIVPGVKTGMKQCDPTGDAFEISQKPMGSTVDSSSYKKYESVVNVDLIKLLSDVLEYRDYEISLKKQQERSNRGTVTRQANVLEQLDPLSPKEMVTKLNEILKRKKWAAGDLVELLINTAVEVDMLHIAKTFNSLGYSENWLTKDGKPAYDVLDEAFQKATYDNGKPLTGYNDPDDPDEWHDFFEHYDRDQDYSEIFYGDRVTKVAESTAGEVQLFLDFSSAQLITWVANEYGGSSYDHDFG